MLKSVITSVEKAAKARSVEECKINCSIYKCCSEKRSEEYSEARILHLDKLLSVEDVREERNKLDQHQQSKEEKKKKRKESKSKESKSKTKKSAPKRKVEVATSPIPKKRKSSDEDNSEGLAAAAQASTYLEHAPVSFPGMSRTAAQAVVKQLGAKATPNTVSKSTGLVVEGEKGGKKANQARDLGIRVITADDFLQIISS
eukprot:scaffold3781_cov149-Skeletonema_dohrnii-CCMP3373.AAC.2